MSGFKVMATCVMQQSPHVVENWKPPVFTGSWRPLLVWWYQDWLEPLCFGDKDHGGLILRTSWQQSLLKSHHPGSGWMKLLFLYRLYQDAYNLPAKGNSHLISHLFWCYLFSGHLLSLKFNWVFVFPVSPRRLAGTKQSSWGQQLFIWKEEKIYS